MGFGPKALCFSTRHVLVVPAPHPDLPAPLGPVGMSCCSRQGLAIATLQSDLACRSQIGSALLHKTGFRVLSPLSSKFSSLCLTLALFTGDSRFIA